MADPNVIVSRHILIDLPRGQEMSEVLRSEAGLTVELDGGRKVRLSPADERSSGYAQILNGLRQLHQPVYLEVDPETGIITKLLIPVVGRVAVVRDVPGGLEVELDSSQSRYRLQKALQDHAEAESLLREGVSAATPLIVTFDDSHTIIDVRPFIPGPDDGPIPGLPPNFPPRRPGPTRISPLGWLRWRFWPWSWYFGCISSVRAQAIFDAMSATSCNPLTVPPPCIPFMYPDDGCWARAHEMGRLMIAMGAKPRKIWIQGSLHTPTRNNPNCFVGWGWHVAPTLCVRRKWRWWRPWPWGSRTMVIDPSLFTTPVTTSGWKAVQGDTGATLTYTDASDYRWGETDPDYSKTIDRLAYYRLQLQLRAINTGPPPYANCP